MIGRRVTRLLWAAIGDDRVGPVLNRMTPEAREVQRLAFIEARELGHPCIADEHVLLGILRHGGSPAAALLRGHGLDLATARADLLAVGPSMSPPQDPVIALRTIGIDVEQIRRQLETTFGVRALHAAERKVRRRAWWRGGHRRPRPLCVYLLAKRAFYFAAEYADQRGDSRIEPDHLLYGVLRDARDPLGTQLGRRNRSALASFGWSPERPNPLRLVLEARGLDPAALAADLTTPQP